MTESKKPTLSLDAIQAKHLRSILGVDINGVSSALEQARATLADAGNFAQAQRLLRENSTMTSFSAKELLRIEAIGTRLDPYKDVRELLHTNVSIQAVIDAAKQHENLTASLANSLQTAQLFSTQLERYRHITTQHEANFRLPQTGEVARLLADMRFDNGSVAAFARKHLGDIAAQTNLITSMSRPWLQEIEAARSAAALLELHGIGSALQSTQGFDDTLTIALRADLGDWRDRITFPSLVFDDPVARTEFYIERGFNSALTDFPDDTFQESLVMFGLDTDVQEVVDWPEAMHATDDIEESAFQRTNKCHNYLQRLERRLRRFIDHVMTTQYGADWPKKRLSPQMLESWEEKRTKAQKGSVVLSVFIEVADFTDYEAIICRRDNWNDVFVHRFKRMESVRESLQRLYPIRLATMHARFVTKEDLLYVLAESMRLLNAIDD